MRMLAVGVSVKALLKLMFVFSGAKRVNKGDETGFAALVSASVSEVRF